MYLHCFFLYITPGTCRLVHLLQTLPIHVGKSPLYASAFFSVASSFTHVSLLDRRVKQT